MPLSRRSLLIVLGLIVGAAVVVAVVVNRSRIEATGKSALAGGDETLLVPSEAMQPTLDVGDSVAVSTERPFELSVGDVVTTKVPGMPATTSTFKRIVAIGPADVAFSDGDVLVNGVVVDEPYLADGTVTEPPENGFLLGCPVTSPCHVPDGSYWGMGDNRPNSMDSRTFGPIALDQVDGVLLAIVTPADRAGPIAGTSR